MRIETLLLLAYPYFGHTTLTSHVPKVSVPVRRDSFCKWGVYITVKLGNLFINSIAHSTITQSNSGDTSRGMHSPTGKNCV